jgi:hypothetical protein
MSDDVRDYVNELLFVAELIDQLALEAGRLELHWANGYLGVTGPRMRDYARVVLEREEDPRYASPPTPRWDTGQLPF